MRKWVQVGVVALTVLLIGSFLVSFIARLRHARDHDRCRFNLEHIGISLSWYHDIYGRFPSGCKPKEGVPPERRLSWLFAIKPYIESRMDESWHHVDWSGCWDAEANHTLVWERYSVYLCPSNTNEPARNSPALTHYVGIAGLGENAALLPTDEPGAGVFGYENSPGQARDRALGIRKEDIKDGVGMTMMVVETTFHNGPWAAGGPSTVRGLDPTRQPYLGPDRQFGGSHRLGSNSTWWAVPRVTNVLFADGSVRSFTEALDARIFEAMVTIAGNEYVGRRKGDAAR